jgi:glycosyltransferase involved in cell wall biosynthesis
MREATALPRVAIDARSLLTPLTGIGQYTFHLAQELGALLPEKPWLSYDGDWAREVRPPPMPSQPGAGAKVKRAIPFAFEAGRFLQQRRFTAGARAHAIGLYHEPNYLAFRFDGPSVVTVHDLSWIHYPQLHPAWRVRGMNAAMPRVVRDAAQIITDSEFVRAEVIAHFGLPAQRVSAVPLGVAPGFRPMEAAAMAPVLAAHGLAAAGYVLAVGTLEPRKNLATVLAAYSGLPEATRKRFPLVVAGMQGWGMEQTPGAMRGMVAAGEVRLLGYVPQASLQALYAGARLFVYPSIYEGFGLPPLEAMASGVPVIASRRGSLPEVVGDAGVLVEPLDEIELREAIARLLEDDAARRALSASGLDQAAKFGWPRCAAETLAVYEKALGPS